MPPCSLTPVFPIFPGHGPATCPHPLTLAPHSRQHEPGPHRGAGGGHVRSGVRPGFSWGLVCGVGWVMLTQVCKLPSLGFSKRPLLLGLQDLYWALGRESPWLCAFALSCLSSPRDIGATWALVSPWSFPCPYPEQSWLYLHWDLAQVAGGEQREAWGTARCTQCWDGERSPGSWGQHSLCAVPLAFSEAQGPRLRRTFLNS